jgi:Calcineurin-like phosphoesterase/Purple acid Phosphatase, N-terminal domain/RTX calcium-binding nonapeptide repeat (4 copies)
MSEFRVNPYLQNPSANGISVTWFTTKDVDATLTVTGPGLSKPLVLQSDATLAPVLAYTTAERNQSIAGITNSWLLDNNNYKHTIAVNGLQPGTTYNYSVTQGSSTFNSTFETAPTATDWSSIRFIAMSDSETEPLGRLTYREWQPGSIAEGSTRPNVTDSQWAKKFGTNGSGTAQTLRYALTETVGYQQNLEIVNSRTPDFLLMPGDLVQGGGYQPGWDEFFRHNAGEYASGLSEYPILPALGNWENFGALNGGYGTDADGRFGPKFGRDKYDVYFDTPANGTPAHQDNYYRVDYGPVTVLTLDSSNGEPDDRRTNYGGAGQPAKVSGTDLTSVGTDTQENYTRAQYESFGGTDLSDFNPGSIQWNWVKAQLQDARSKGQIIFIQFHHAPYSDGEHGQPMNHTQSTGQGGTPLRQYQGMFEEYGVAAVLSGHSEMFERSFVDENRDGIGVNYFDVGVSGDGLRGEKRTGAGFDTPLLNYNQYSQWTADQNAAEVWKVVNGVPQLIDGGKHYGHLEVNIEPFSPIPGIVAKIQFTPVYSFPILDANYNLVTTERRVYDDETILLVTDTGRVINSSLSPDATVALLKENLVAGTSGNDVIIANAPGSKVDGINDTIFTGAGNDEVDTTLTRSLAIKGHNRIFMGSGNDLSIVTDNDRSFGSMGDDIFEANDAKNYRLSGGEGNDTFYLGASGRALGGEGNDKFFAGSGGSNLLSGGAGADQFWIANAEIPTAANTILDFQIGTDVIGIQGAKSLGISATSLKLTQVGADTSIDFGGKSLALLTGIQASSLSLTNTSQFVFA